MSTHADAGVGVAAGVAWAANAAGLLDGLDGLGAKVIASFCVALASGAGYAAGKSLYAWARAKADRAPPAS